MSNDSRGEDVAVRHDADGHRYVATVGGEDVGSVVYYETQGRYLFTHTEVDSAYEGKGVASALVRGALDQLRGADGTMVPLCPYVKRWVDRHDDYKSLIDEDLEMALRP